MQTVILLMIIPLILIFLQTVLAKNNTIGLYMTLQDYEERRLSYVYEGARKEKIKFDILFGTSTVVVMQDEKKEVFSKSEIFGYRIGEQDYRFFNNAEYHILDNKQLFIYSCNKSVEPGTRAAGSNEQYYFSSNPAAPIQPLTIDTFGCVYNEKDNLFRPLKAYLKVIANRYVMIK